MVGDDVEITVVQIRGDKVRLGFTAPKSVSVHRREIWLAIQQEQRAAKDATPADVSEEK